MIQHHAQQHGAQHHKSPVLFGMFSWFCISPKRFFLKENLMKMA